nr:hypothetical protein [Tanacetum cinerariifolium]
MKARGTLLMALSNKDQLKFHSYKGAKLLMEAIEKRYGGNKESKMVQRTLLKQQYENFAASSSETLDQTFDRLLYPPTAQAAQMKQITLLLELVQLILKPNSPQLAREYLEQIDHDDLEEMDLHWEMAMLTIRARRASKNQENRGREYGRKPMLVKNPTENALIAQDGIGGYDWSYQAKEEHPTNYALMALTYSRSSFSSDSKADSCSRTCIKAYATLKEQYDKNQENVKSRSDKGYHAVPPPYTGNYIPPKPDLMFIDEQVESEFVDVVSNVASSDVKTVESKHKSVDVKNKGVEFEHKVEVKIVRPSIEKIKFVKTAREKLEKVATPKQNKHYPRENQRNWNNLMSQRLRSNFKMINKTCFVCSSFDHLHYVCDQRVVRPMWNNTRRMNHKNFANKMTHPHPKRRFVPHEILTKSGKLKTAGSPVNTTRPVNTIDSKLIMNYSRPISNAFKRGNSQVIRPYNKYSAYKKTIFNQMINTVRVKHTTARERAVVSEYMGREANAVKASACWGNPQQKEYKEKRVIDSGCSRALVIKPHNKTPYELIRGRPPLIDFMKPFGCPVTILNTRDSLGKFDEKTNETFFVGYYMVRKQTNGIAGTKDNIVAGQAKKKKEPEQEYILIPISTTDPLISQGPKDNAVDDGKKATEVDESLVSDNGGQDDQVTRSEFEGLLQQERQTEHINSTNSFNTVFSLVNTVGPSFANTASPSHNNAAGTPATVEEDIDMNNVVSSYTIPDAPLAKFLTDHPKDQKPVQALKDPSWVKAMQDELLQFKLLKVWTLVDLPKDKWEIGTKWVFRNKKDKRGIMIEEEVYVYQPPGFEDPNFPDKVYKVEKALYGLHQAPKVWFQVTPKTSHLYAVKRIFKYLKGQPKLGLWYPRDLPFDLESYSDSDYAGASLDRKSATGVDGKKVIVNEASIKRDLRLDDAEGTACLPNDAIFEGLARIGKHKPRRKQRKATEVSHTEPQAEERVSTPSRDPLPSGEDRLQLNELMDICIKLSDRVLSLKQTKTNQAAKIEKLKKIVKKLEGKKNKRNHCLNMLYKVGLSARVESSKDEKGLGAQEDASNQGKIAEIHANEDLFLIDETKQDQGRIKDQDLFGLHDLNDDDVFVDVTTGENVEQDATVAESIEENVEGILKKTQAELTKGSSKRARQELEQESANKQKLVEQEQAKVADDDIIELKRCLEIVPEDDDDDVPIKATPLSSKSPTIVDYKIYKEGKKSYFKIIRADGNSQNYLTF